LSHGSVRISMLLLGLGSVGGGGCAHNHTRRAKNLNLGLETIIVIS